MAPNESLLQITYNRLIGFLQPTSIRNSRFPPFITPTTSAADKTRSSMRKSSTRPHRDKDRRKMGAADPILCGDSKVGWFNGHSGIAAYLLAMIVKHRRTVQGTDSIRFQAECILVPPCVQSGSRSPLTSRLINRSPRFASSYPDSSDVMYIDNYAPSRCDNRNIINIMGIGVDWF